MSKLTTTSEEPVFIPEYDIAELGRNGHGRLCPSIHGYWSSEPITLYIDRATRYDKEWSELLPNWKAKISHSSGGRDYDEEPCDLRAATNYAAAMTELAAIGDDIIARLQPELETAFQAQRAVYEAEALAEAQAKQDKIDQDTPYGIDRATALVNDVTTNLGQFAHRNIEVLDRGQEGHRLLTAMRKGSKHITWWYRDQRQTSEQVIDILATSSNRSGNTAKD
jgi:hypothetical protein